MFQKVNEELNEFKSAMSAGSQEQMHEEMGDLLFALVNLSRFMNINPEEALRRAVEKFKRRFQKLEKILEEDGKDIKHTTLEYMDRIWNIIKKNGDHNQKSARHE